MTLSPTPEQSQIISTVATQPQSLMISAYAGTAKTTTLQLAAPGIKVPALALAFNKKIAMELKPRLPGNFDTKTLNGLGHSAWARTLNQQGLKLDDRKLGKLVSQTAKDFKISLTSSQWDLVRHLTSAAMLAGLSPGNQGDPLLEDSECNWRELIDVSEDDWSLVYDLAREVLIQSISLARSGTISFDDQIYCPTILGGRWPQFPAIVVDESQDLSPLNHRMIQLALRPQGRLIAVGDPRQAIYAFRGADSQSMSTMRALSNQWLDHSLTLTFRCPKVIVSRQQAHAPGFEAHQSCMEGRVGNVESFIPEAEDIAWTFANINNELLKLGYNQTKTPAAAILCRNNSPLLSLAFKLLRRGIGCIMLGRDIGKGLIQLSNKLSPEDSTPILAFTVKLLAWSEHETSLARANDKPDKVERILDQTECLRAVIDGSGARTVGDLREALSKLFARESGPITLSSIHRAKGLEWDLVVHLDPWRIPSKWALKHPRQLEQEKNLLYVCETRTRHTLLNLNLEDFH